MRKSVLFISLLFSLSMLFSSCGKDGEVGPAGTDGLVGSAGADGSQIYSGQGVPASDKGVNGDYYLDLNAGILYGPKTDGNWAEGFGLFGDNGTNGTDGSVIHSGLSLPVTETGLPDGYKVGDFFLDTDEYLLYGPLKEVEGSASWGLALQLKGADGNANVQTFKLTINDTDWAYGQNTTTTSYKWRVYDTEFSALTEDIVENGVVLVYMKNTVNGYQLMPIVNYKTNSNLLRWESRTKIVGSTYRLEIKATLEARNDVTETLYAISPVTYKIVVIQGNAAGLIGGGTKKVSIEELSQQLGVEL